MARRLARWWPAARPAVCAASAALSRVIDPLRPTPPLSAAGGAGVGAGGWLTGWVPADGDGEVVVHLNRRAVVRLPLVLDPKDAARRRWFRIGPLLRYAHPTDRLTVRHRGRALPFEPGRAVYRPPTAAQRPPLELRLRLARGEIVNSNGQLQRPKDADRQWQLGVLDLYDIVRAAVRETHGYDVFLTYGSLLGAVRDGGFIGHDTDLDAGYISAATTGPAAGRELADLARALIARGLRVETRVIVLHIYDPAAPDVHIDLFHTFFDEAGVLRFPWGVAGTRDYRRAQWTGAAEIEFAGRRVLAPSDPAAMVETIYGSGWRTPDPGFSWAADRTTRDVSGRVPRPLNIAANWIDHYVRAPLGEPTPFARDLLARLDRPATIVDLGCGDGRDSVLFAAAGHRVVGLDVAPTAITRARSRAAGGRFEEVDVARPAAVRRAVRAARPGAEPIVFYAHRLLDALDEPTSRRLITALAAEARPGDTVAFASAVTAGPERALRPRRAVAPSELRDVLLAAGFALEVDTVDARMHRVLARRPVAFGHARRGPVPGVWRTSAGEPLLPALRPTADGG